MKKIRLTESDLHRIIKESARRILKEYIGDEEEFGRYDLEGDLPFDIENNNENHPSSDMDPFDGMTDEEMEEYHKDMEADQYIGQEYYDPGDGDLYRNF